MKTESRCFTYTPTKAYPTLEDWFESFPHVYMLFEPNAYIPLYPRDYFFLENGLQCLAFDYLEGRVILGGVFMRNFDLQFDRDNQKVRMVRANCSPAPGFDFFSYYMAHTDDREEVHPIDKTKAPEIAEIDHSPVTVEVKGEGTRWLKQKMSSRRRTSPPVRRRSLVRPSD